MKFSKKKFVSQNFSKKKKIIYQQLLAIEKDFKNQILKDELHEYLSYFLPDEIDENLKPIFSLIKNFSDTLQQFSEYLVTFEQTIREVKDSDFLVEIGDGKPDEVSTSQTYVFVHNLRSAFNIGSIFRTAESFGFSKVFLSGYSVTPENNKLKKSAMGTDDKIDWEYLEDPFQKILELKQKGVKIIALETVRNADYVFNADIDCPVAILLGNEALGMEDDMLKIADEIVKIPRLGWKNSLNVGVAFSIVSYEIIRQRLQN